MPVVAGGEAVEAALGKMRTMLGVDGYDLEVAVHEGAVILAVRATPRACAECLAPKSLMKSMAADMLAKAGVELAASDLRITYPGEGPA